MRLSWLLVILGAAFIVAGVAWLSLPFGLITAGIACVGVGALRDFGGGREAD